MNNKFFINVAGVGFDAQVVANKDKFNKLKIKGLAAYILSVLYTLFSLKTHNVRIQTAEKSFEQKILIAAAGNGEWIGGGMQITPNARINDGKLNICIIDSVPAFIVPVLLPKFIKGDHIKLRICQYFESETIQISSDTEMLGQVDGELVWNKDYTITNHPKSLRIICPYSN